ncbi:MAG TPA: rhodanese-like domain-containing protein, partial [Saprospiraceae bacterium]|nr:rhodanese-like domain-containing protein [Saprospiraceae bacterium]
MKTVVDVRTPGEFAGGHVPGSVNIPLNLVPERLEDFRKMKQPIVLCCASGGRSGQARGPTPASAGRRGGRPDARRGRARDHPCRARARKGRGAWRRGQ